MLVSVRKLKVFESILIPLKCEISQNFLFCPGDKNPGNISKFCQIFVPSPHQSSNNFIIITIPGKHFEFYVKLMFELQTIGGKEGAIWQMEIQCQGGGNMIKMSTRAFLW